MYSLIIYEIYKYRDTNIFENKINLINCSFSGYIVENQNYSRTVIITQCLFAKNVCNNSKTLRI